VQAEACAPHAFAESPAPILLCTVDDFDNGIKEAFPPLITQFTPSRDPFFANVV
jgi:hypothetical protein